MFELVPGTLFIVLMALAAYMVNDFTVVIILALGCAAGWQTFGPDPKWANAFRLLSLALWALAVVLLVVRIYL